MVCGAHCSFSFMKNMDFY